MIDRRSFQNVGFRNVASIKVLDDFDFNTLWDWWNRAPEQQERAPENVIPLYRPIFQQEATMEIREKPKTTDDDSHSNNTENGTYNGSSRKFVEFETRCAPTN